MANLMQIKRSSNTAVPASLSDGELAFSGNGDVLFIGNFGSVTAVGGARTPGTLTANQAIVVDSNSKINNIIATDITLEEQLTANGATGSAGQVLYSGGAAANAYWGDSSAGSIAGLEDTDTTGAAAGDFLYFNGSNWVDADLTDGNGLSKTAVSTAGSESITLDVTAGNGVTSNSTGVHVEVSGDSSLVANSSGLFIDDSTLSITASQISDDIALGTDTSGNYVTSVSAGNGLTGTGLTATEGGTPSLSVLAANNTIAVGAGGIAVNESNLSITASQISDDIALGTDTSGDYVEALSPGNGISVVNNTGEGATPGVSVNAQDGLVANSSGLFAEITLGTHTDSNYVASITGTANEVEVDVSTGAVTIGLPNDVTIGQNLTVSGNLVVSGTTTTVNSTTLTVDDPLIKLADGNDTTDAVDIGFYGLYDSSGSQDLYAGFFRDSSDGKFRMFRDLQSQPTTTVNTGGTGYAVATLVAHLEDDSVSITGGSITGITDLAVADGGTGASSFTDNGVIYGNGASALSVTAQGAEGHVLQADASGVPTFGSLDGGTF